jgi:glycosyltransferase involved in cell wall biosynthesis
VAHTAPHQPGVSVIMATLNAEKYLDECLAALRAQDYPRELMEIVIADGGSTDRTLEIARHHGVDLILDNPGRTGEAGKAVALHAASNELILHVDSDNVVVGNDWLTRMVAPLADPEVTSSEALRWEYRREDHFINRYQALTGINDPMAIFVGNYDRYSELTGRWTDYPYTSEQRDGWEKVWIDPEHVPTMGANGYLVRRRAYDVVEVDDYLFDIDVAYELVQAGMNCVARVDVPIRHYFCDSVLRFYRKTRRRTDDFYFFAAQGRRSYPWTSRQRAGVLRFVVSTVLVWPLLAQISRGMSRKRDLAAWCFHLAACWITLVVYAVGTVKGRLRPAMLDREGWSQ